MNKLAFVTVTAILVTAAGILGTLTMSATIFAQLPPKDDGASGLAPGENQGQDFPPPNTFAPGNTGSPPGQIVGPDSPGETDETAPGQIVGPDSPQEDSPGQIVGPDSPSENAPGKKALDSGIVGPD